MGQEKLFGSIMLVLDKMPSPLSESASRRSLTKTRPLIRGGLKPRPMHRILDMQLTSLGLSLSFRGFSRMPRGKESHRRTLTETASQKPGSLKPDQMVIGCYVNLDQDRVTVETVQINGDDKFGSTLFRDCV